MRQGALFAAALVARSTFSKGLPMGKLSLQLPSIANLQLARDERRRRRRRDAAPPSVEPLDRRLMLAVTASFAEGTLRVTGDDQDNVITISRNPAGAILVN